jgi:hypothetical protein
MSKLVALVFLVALAAVPASARANEAMLWACHGPDGRTLPISYDASRSAGAFITATSAVPCASPADTIRLGFDDTSPPEGSFAALRFNPPAGGVTIAGVWLGRRVTGPGYFARTSAGDLETLDGAGTLDGVFTQAATGSWVELGVRCASAGCDMTGTALDFRFIALKVRDEARPTLAIGTLPAYAAGTLKLTVDARDNGIGLASIGATLGGVPLASAALGLHACSELSPGDATVDLPLYDDCPGTRRLTLSLDSTAVADGVHRLEITATDGAGNATVQGYDLKVVNHPPVSVTPTPVPTRTPAPTPTATPQPVPNTAVLTAVKRYTVSRTGALAAEASCPKRAASSCPVALTLRAKLPGRKKTATIATARASVRPGAKAKVALRLSAAARSALAKKRSLSATLTLAGAKPVPVKLAR